MSERVSPSPAHIPVLLEESLAGLAIAPNGIYVDGTFGRGGHSTAILNALGENGRLIVFDRDPQAIEVAESMAKNDPRMSVIHSAFGNMVKHLESLSLVEKIDGVLLDLGVSSPQLDQAQRGFSFMQDGPLDMRMDTTRGESAAKWLSHAEEDEIAQVIKRFGEEKFGKRIAHGIVNARAQSPIETTHQLAQIVDDALPVKEKHKHPATRTFQAIRIFINSEFEQLELGLEQALAVLKPKGRMAIISFHSLEDRIVKRYMKEQSQGRAFPIGLPITQEVLESEQTLRLIGKAQKPSEKELAVNVRARSAVLRVAEKR